MKLFKLPFLILMSAAAPLASIPLLLSSLSLTALVLLSSCSHSDGTASDAEPVDASEALRKLAQSDHDQLSTLSFANQVAAKSEMGQSAKTFFGGLTGTDFQKYLDTRIRYFLTQDEAEHLSSPDLPANLLPAMDTANGGSAKAEVLASNLGGALWANALANGYPNGHLNFRNTAVALNDPRVGLMLIGEGYHDSLTLDNGETVPIPSVFRQAVLLHEARHSDCTGGIPPADLEVLRTSLSGKELVRKLKNMDCLHRHSFCPKGHDYEGLAACDPNAWGAYTAGAMFTALSLQSVSGTDKRFMEASLADQLSRMQLDTDKMFHGDFGPPDLSSSALVR